MNTIEEQVETLRTNLEAEAAKVVGEVEMAVATRFTLADAIRLGSTVSDQAYTWTDGEGNMCAMSAAVVAAKARGYM